MRFPTAVFATFVVINIAVIHAAETKTEEYWKWPSINWADLSKNDDATKKTLYPSIALAGIALLQFKSPLLALGTFIACVGVVKGQTVSQLSIFMVLYAWKTRNYIVGLLAGISLYTSGGGGSLF